jgi:hypothetical protein
MFSSKIKVVGEKEEIPSYYIGERVIKVGRWFYWKDSNAIVKVRVKEGYWGGWESEYLLRGSKSIVEGLDGSRYHKNSCVKLEEFDNLWDYKHSDYVVKHKGKYYYTDSVVEIKGNTHLVSDPEVVRLNHNGWGLKKDCIRMSKRFFPIQKDKMYVVYNKTYTGDRFNAVWVDKMYLMYGQLVTDQDRAMYQTPVMNEPSPIEKLDGGSNVTIREEHDLGGRRVGGNKYTEVYCSDEDFKTKHLVKANDAANHFHQIDSGEWVCITLRYSDPLCYLLSDYQVVCGVKDGNIYVDRDLIQIASIFHDDITNNPDKFEFSNRFNKYFYKPLITAEEFHEKFDEDKMEYMTEGITRARELVEANYSENGPDENQADKINVSWVRPRGGRPIVDRRHKEAIWSPSSKRFGSKKYTFGVEIETTYGKLSSYDIEQLKIAMVSDGSIRAGEYITSPLQGDLGYRNLRDMMYVISNKCLVADEGAAHVHIGGAKFNRRFSIISIMLACQLEREMFLMQPTIKDPRLKYCAGISKDYGVSPKDNKQWCGNYSNIDFDNWKEVLGEYVFGQPFDRENNSLAEVFRWSDQRYKWLNLINCNSNGRFETIEFRIFGVTTNFDKIYNYVLISMAFVWFVENKQARIIKSHNDYKVSGKGCTLEEVITSAFKNRADLAIRLIDFVNARKLRFNRKDI